MLSWKAFWSVLTVVGTGTVAVLGHLAALPFSAATGVVAGSGVLFVLIARWSVYSAPLFAQVPDQGRRQIVSLLWSGAVIHLVWVVCAQLRPDLWAAWLLALAMIGCVQYWAARGHQYMVEHLTRTPTPEVAQRELEAAGQDNTTRIINAAFTQAGYSWLSVLRWESVGDPAFGIRVWVRMPSRMAMTKAGEKSKDPGLSPTAAEPIAIGLAEILKREILSDWVQIQKEAAAGTYTILVVTEDVMARIYPWVDKPGWASIKTPKLYGYQMDGLPYYVKLGAHAQVSGQSRGGKSSLLHVEFAQVSLCSDAVIWVAGVEKLYDLVGGWVEPYMGSDHRLPFDWVASGQSDLLNLLVSAMTIARWRQRQPMNTRQGFTTIILYLDEASFALRNTKVKAEYQGMAYTAAQLVAMLTQGAGSAGVHVRFISQRGVNGHFGDQGGDTTANAGFTAVFKTKDPADIGRLVGDYRLPVPRHPGEYWIEAGDGPVKLKAPYLQEVDPSKPVLHDGDTVSTVAWARRNFARDLDAGSANVAGDVYAGRHTRATPELMTYLTGTDVVIDYQTDERSEGFQAALEELDRTGLGTPAAGVPLPDLGGGVTTLVGRRSRAARIAGIVENSAVPLSKGDIRAALLAMGDKAPDQAVTNALTKLLAEEVIQRPERGLYQGSDAQ